MRFSGKPKMKTALLLVILSFFLVSTAHRAMATELHSDGFESGDKTGFDGTRSGTATPDTDAVQSTVKATCTYAWRFDQQTNDYTGALTNSVYFTQSMPTTDRILLQANVRIDTLTHQSGDEWALLFTYSSDNGPNDPSAGLVIDVTNNYIGVFIQEADSTFNVSLGTTAFDVDDKYFHELMVLIDNSGSNPVLTAWYDGTQAHQYTFSGVTLPNFQSVDFGSWPRQTGNHDIDAYFDDFRVYDGVPYWYDSNWQYRKKLTFDRTMVAADQTDFPVLVSLLTDGDLANDAQNDFDDILFTHSNGITKLDHEIESYDPDDGKLIAWVKVPSLSSTSDTSIYMYYGNGSACNQEYKTGVWSNGYNAVWHLREAEGGTDAIKDSTRWGNHGTDSDPDPIFQATGKIGYAIDFNGSNNYINCGDTSSLDISGNKLTISAWVAPDFTQAQGALGKVVDKRGPTNQDAYRLFFNANIDDWRFNLSTTPDGFNATDTAGLTWNANDWHYLVATYDGSDMYIYWDDTNSFSTSHGGTITTNDANLYIATGLDLTSNHFFDGTIDEVRISSTDRSLSWTQTEYKNQNNQGTGPGKFIKILGSEETESTACQFSYRRSITVDGDEVGGTDFLYDFPVLVNLSETWLQTAPDGDIQNANGYDIVFRAFDDTCDDEGSPCTLDHEIEEYDGTNGELVAWVRVPKLYAGSTSANDTKIYMYYGNGCTTDNDDPQNKTAVWDTNNGWRGVWHLHELSGDAQDSTSYGRSGTVSGEVTQGSGGRIDGAYDFGTDSGGNGTVNFGDHTNHEFGTNSFTVSLWLNSDKATGVNQVFLYKGEYGENNAGYDFRTGSGATAIWFAIRDDSNNSAMSTVPSIDQDQWMHIVGVVDRSVTPDRLRIYKNGLEYGTATDISSIGTLTDSSDSIDLIFSYANSSEMDGVLDEVRIYSGVQSADWILTEYKNQKTGSTFYSVQDPPDSSPATAVTLLSFTARGDDDQVKVSWQTAQEVGNLGFHLYRSESRGGPFVRLTDELIPGLISSVQGKAYVYEDGDVTAGMLYYYKLEAIDTSGKKTLHGPVCVDWDGDGMPDDWEMAHGLDPGFDDSSLDSDFDGLTNREEYDRGTDPFNPDTDGDGILDGEEGTRRDRDEGEVSRSLTRGVEILLADETGVTLELRTDGFDTEWMEAEGELFSRLRISDYIHGFTEEKGKPELPTKGVLLDLPEGKGATLEVLETDGETYSGYWIYPVPERVLDEGGGLSHVAELFTIDEAAYSRDFFYPGALARLGETFTFRDEKKLQVLLYPLAFNPTTRELTHYRRIRVRIHYEASHEVSLMGAAHGPSGLEALAWSPPSGDPSYKISISEEGIYRLTGPDFEGMTLSQVRLYNLGEEVAISVYDQDGDDLLESADGDHIAFYGRPVETDYAKYTRQNVYWLTPSGGSGVPKRMAEFDGTPGSGAIPATHTTTVHDEGDERYWMRAPGGDSLDRWFYDSRLFGQDYGGGAVDFTLTLSDVADQGSLVISLYGATEIDHEVDVTVNGTPLGSYTWSGISSYEATISPVSLLEGANTVSLECLSGLDVIYVDSFSVTYPRGFTAEDDSLKFTHETGYRYQVSGFTSADVSAYDITSAGEVEGITGFQVTGSGPYMVEFEPPGAAGERTYLVLASGGVKSPSGISQDSPSTLADPANGADYIVITHRDLGWDGGGQLRSWLADLVALREAQGLRVEIVDVEDIFDEFSYGITTPQAIKDFLTHAYTSWTSPAPQYLLLLGAGTYDYKNNWNLDESQSKYVPTYLSFTEYMGETATDEWFSQVSGNDAIPDLYIGRLPAADTAQAATMVNKIITYETTPNTKTWEKSLVLVADNQTQDFEAVFETMNEEVASLIPSGLNLPFKGYLGDYFTPGDLTQDIKDQISAGALMVNYSGHGSTQIWADEQIFDTADVLDLTNGAKLPFFVSMSCLVGYFAYPESVGFPSLAEALLREEAKGAVAGFMPTGMTTTVGQEILDGALFEAIFTEDIRVLGQAVLRSKETLLANGSGFAETSETFLLFGDPAMELKVPLPRRPTGVSVQSGSGGINISWSEARDCDGGPVSGYNVYRRAIPGGAYTKLNSSLITGTIYEDTSAETGTTFSYVVTSLDSDGDESVQSQQASATPANPNSTASGGGGGCFIAVAAGYSSWQ